MSNIVKVIKNVHLYADTTDKLSIAFNLSKTYNFHFSIILNQVLSIHELLITVVRFAFGIAFKERGNYRLSVISAVFKAMRILHNESCKQYHGVLKFHLKENFLNLKMCFITNFVDFIVSENILFAVE